MRRVEHVFLVRMWSESVSEGRHWRGSVQHVGSARRLYVSGTSQVADFIELQLDDAEKPVPEELPRE